MNCSVDSIETFGLVDGPGIRTVIFFTGCSLRCKYCHNPEMWEKKENNYTIQDLAFKVIRNKPYFKRNGGVTYSGGEPLLQVDALIMLSKILKEEGISIALDTSGVGIGKYDEILELVDLVLLDIKHVDENGYYNLTGNKMNEVERFIQELNKSGKPVWIRQVIVPGVTDQEDYLYDLAHYLKKIPNIEKIEFLPFHHLGFSKYDSLGISNPLEKTKEMNPIECEKIYQKFLEILKEV